jgi:alpha-1,6-mannosyltransferase
VVSGAHLDVVVGALALAVLLLVRKGHPTIAMIAAVAACMIKLPGLFLVGYVGLDVLRRTDTSQLRARLAQVVGAAAAVVLATVALVPDAFGWVRALSVPGSIRSGLAPSTWVSWLFQYAGGLSAEHATTIARLLTALVGGLVAARLLWHATEGPERSAYFGVGWGLVAIAFSGPTAYPWYLTWGLFAAAIGSRARGRFVLLAISVMYALLGAYGGGRIGIVAMVACFAVAALAMWRTARAVLAIETPTPTLTPATV